MRCSCLLFPSDGILYGKELWAQPRVRLAWQRRVVHSLGGLEGTGSGTEACHSSEIV